MSYFEMRAAGAGRVEIDLFGEITPYAFAEGDTSALQFKNALKDQGPAVREIVLNVNSPGGSVFEGNAIYNTLKFHPAKVTANVMAVAASIASVIIMSADEINIAPNAAVMIHEPHVFMGGTSSDLRKQADLLDSIRTTAVEAYVERTKLNAKEIREMIAAETWLFAEDAIAKGFADNVMEVEETDEAFAMYGAQAGEVLMKYSKLPESIKALVEAAEPESETVDDPQLSGDRSASAPEPEGSPAPNPAPTADKEPIQPMDKETLMSEHADIANSVQEDAVKAERERVTAIRNAALPGYEELVDQNIANGASLTDFLLAQNGAEQGRIEALNKSQMEGDNAPAGRGGKDDEPKDRPQVDNKFVRGIYDRMNSK